MTDSDIKKWLEQCRSEEPVRQVEAIQHLVELGAYTSVPTLIETLKSPDSVVRCTAAEALGHLGAKDREKAGAALLDAIKDPEVIVRSDAVDALGILGYVPAVGAVKALLGDDPEPLVRISAAETLGDLGDTSAITELEAALGDSEDSVRGFAANSIGLLGSPAILPKLQSYSKAESSPRVKAELYGASYRLGSAEDLDALLKLLENADVDLAPNILNVLDDLSRRKQPPALRGDAARIRDAVKVFAQRVPLLNADAEQILDHMAKLQSPE